jgi:hypothetical protein
VGERTRGVRITRSLRTLAALLISATDGGVFSFEFLVFGGFILSAVLSSKFLVDFRAHDRGKKAVVKLCSKLKTNQLTDLFLAG